MKNINLPLAGIAVALAGAVASTAVYSTSFPRSSDSSVLVIPAQQGGGQGKQDEKQGLSGTQSRSGSDMQGSQRQKGTGGGAERNGKSATKDGSSERRAEKGTRSQRNVEVNRDRNRRGGADVRIYTDAERRRGRGSVGVAPGRVYGYAPGGCQAILQRYRACMRER